MWLFAALLWAGAAQAVLYRCPGNLFTNELAPAQARAQACVPAVAAGWSQAQRRPGEPLAAPVATVAEHALNGNPATAAFANPSTNPSTSPATQPGTPAASAVPARVVFNPAVAPRPEGAAAPQRVSPAVQQARDRDAAAVLQAELARTLAEQQALAASNSADSPARQRLRADEQALRRELDRLAR